MSNERNIAYFVIDPEVHTDKADDFFEMEYKHFQRAMTSNHELAIRFIEEYRQNILILAILTRRESPSFEKLLGSIHDIPYVLIIHASEKRNEIERILDGEKVHEPFDSILESWLRNHFGRQDTGELP